MPLPTFVIAGAQKSGTTSLADTMRQHRQIQLSRPKELHFFDRHFDRGLEWYASKFHPEPQATQVGEATPAYMYDPVARKRLTATLPEARIVVILRNPVDRAYSHYWHKRRLGGEHLPSFEEAVAAEPERLAADDVRSRIGFAYVDRGHYARQIDDLVAHHGHERVHVMLLDDLVSDRVPTLERLLTFLDIDPAAAEGMKVKKHNRFRAGTAADAPDDAYPPMAPETRARLAEVYAESNARLAELLGRELPGW